MEILGPKNDFLAGEILSRDGSGLARPEIKPDGPAFLGKKARPGRDFRKSPNGPNFEGSGPKKPDFRAGENLRKNGLKLSKIPLKLSKISPKSLNQTNHEPTLCVLVTETYSTQ